MKGYAGRFGLIDLSKEKVKIITLGKSLAKQWIGGNGFGISLLNKLYPKVDPFDPRAVLIFATGPLTGTILPCTGRCGVFTRSPQTGFLGESYSGGAFGAELKFSGFDGLIVKGKSKKPVYLLVQDEIEIRKANDLWGRTTFETEKIIKKDTDAKSVASIGQAGENKVLYACINNDYGRSFGRCGIGAVLGSKNLKAIAVRGNKDLEVENLSKIIQFMRNWSKEVVNTPGFKSDTKYGTGGGFVEFLNEKGVLPTRNFQSGKFENAKKLSDYYKLPNILRCSACYSCDKPCGKIFRSDRYKIIAEAPEYESTYSLGSNCGCSDIEDLVYAHYLCDAYGLDVISAGATIAWAMECYERGLIGKQDTEVDLRFGNSKAIIELIPKIAMREGIGELLSQGVKKASEKIKGSKEFAVEVKGLEFPGYDVRGLKGLGLSFATGVRGSCHLRTCAYAVELTGSFDPLGFKNVDRFSIQKASLIIKMENLMSLYDSLIMCKFSRSYFKLKDLAKFLKWVTGFEYDERELMEIGDKIYNAERSFNKKLGWTKRDDYLPPRMKVKVNGNRISDEDLKKMKEEYYKLRKD